MKTLLVTLVSNQTIPNIQFIKEMRDENTQYLFLSTKKMENEFAWIVDACKIEKSLQTVVEVKEYSIIDIREKLDGIKNFDEFDRILVNVTGGTKVMSLTATDYFRDFKAEIYYVTGVDGTILKIHPKSSVVETNIKHEILLPEYISGYGFLMQESSLSGVNYEYIKRFFSWFLQDRNTTHKSIISDLRKYRDSKILLISQVTGLSAFLAEIDFPLSDIERKILKKAEIKFLTGEWFEEYIYYRLKEELSIHDENIKNGAILRKNNTPNEFDVIFLYKGTLYTIECKTSIVNRGGDPKAKPQNLITETIYKAAALQKNFGLFSKFAIFTLSSKENDEIREVHLKRGKLFNINVFTREDLTPDTSIAQLLNIKLC